MKRPILRIKKSKAEKTIDAITVVIILTGFMTAAFYYPKLPAQIPIHFNAEGEADGFGAKSSIWLMPILNLLIFFVLLQLMKYPHLFNYPYPITEENAKENYKLAVNMLRGLNLLVAGIFTYINFQTIFTSLNWSSGLGNWFLPIFILIFMLFIIINLIKFNRLKNK